MFNFVCRATVTSITGCWRRFLLLLSVSHLYIKGIKIWSIVWNNTLYKSLAFRGSFWYFCWKVVTFLICQLKSLWHKNVENLFCSREFWFDLYCNVVYNFLIKCKLLFQYCWWRWWRELRRFTLLLLITFLLYNV